MKNRKIYNLTYLVLILIFSFQNIDIKAQTPIDVGNQLTTFSSMVRGYYFTAPCSFTICGLYIPTNASSDFQNVEVVRFTAGPPPAYSGTTNSFVSLFYQNYYYTNAMIPCNIQINAGDVIGVYGARGSGMTNSYGPSQHNSNIMGNPVTFYRSGMQYNLATSQMHDIWSEVNYYIGRVIMYINCCPTADFTINNPNPLCVGSTSTVTYTGSGSAPATSFSWTFNGGSPPSATGQGPHNVTWTTAGTHNVSLTVNQSGCSSASNTQQVTVNASPTANAGPDQGICAGQSATLTGSGGNTYQWSTGANSNTITVSPTVTTTYTLTVTAIGGCSASDEVVVNVNPSPNANAGQDQVICDGSAAVLVASGGGTYLWSTGSTANAVSVSPATTSTYTLTVTNSYGCTDTDDVIVTVNANPNVSAGIDQTICIGENASLTGTGANTYAWSSGGNTATVSVSPTTTTTYTVTGTNSNGCTATDQVVVNVNPNPTANAGQDQVICVGGSISLTATGGGSYLWSNNGNQATTNVSPTTTTTYTVTVTNSYGCTDTDDVVVTVNATPTANAGQDQSICSGSQASLSATGGSTFLWSNGGSTSTISVAPTTTTTYVVTVSDVNNCSATDDVVVTVNPNPVANAGLDQIICIGDNISLNGSGGGNYLWSNGGTTATITVSPTTTTTYTLTVTDANNCTDVDNAIVTVNPAPTANAGADVIICDGSSTTLTATGGSAYLWSNGGSTASITVSPGTTSTYTLTVTNGFNCSATDDVYVTVNPNPVANAGTDQTICDGETATLSASGGGTYTWNPGGAGQIINVTPSTTTTYTLTVTDQNNCTDTDEMVVTVNPLPQADAGLDEQLCIGNSVTLTASGGVSYSWNTSPPQTTASITVSPSITTTYIVTVTGAGNCSATDDVVVNVFTNPPANAGTDQEVCYGDAAQLTATGGGTYLWSNSSTSASISVSPLTTTTYTVTVSLNGCTGTDDVIVTVNPLPNIAINPASAILCIGDTLSLNATGGDTYAWSPAIGLSGTTGSTVLATPNITTTYTVIGTSPQGCTSTASTSITVDAIPVVVVSPGAPSICDGDNVVLNASGANSYTWSPATGLSSTSGAQVTASPSADITYTVTGSSLNGCTSDTTVVVTVYPSPQISIIADPDDGCQPLQVSFSASSTPAATAYSWDFGDPGSTGNTAAISSPSHLYIGPGTYDVSLTITTADGCTGTLVEPGLITVYPQPTASFYMQPPVVSIDNPIVNFVDNSTNATSWTWNFGDPSSGSANSATTSSPTHTYSSTGDYTVWLYVESSNGCRDSIYNELTVEQEFTIYIPSAFSPNDDGLNDVFNPQGIGFDTDYYQMMIFDRWGKRVFGTYSSNVGWNGIIEGTDTYAAQGVYSYVILVRDLSGLKHKYIGRVTLIY